MKAFTGLLAILLLGAIQAKDRPCLNFAGELYQRVRKSLPENDDFLISPLGVSSVLGTLLSAVNQTAGTEIANFLYPKCESEIAPRPSIRQRQGSEITMATVALVRRGVTVDKQFEKNAAELDSDVFKTSFSNYQNEFNEFVFNKTNDRSFFAMDGLFMDNDLIGPSTRLLFYNRVKFIAQFEQKFSLVEGKLIAPKVQALYSNVAELKARVLGLPLLNTTANLLILVPQEGAKLVDVERRLRRVDVRKLPSRLTPRTMNVTLRNLFEHKYLFLREALWVAGIKSVFNETTTEVSGFNGEVPLDNVLVATRINLLEDGINTDLSNSQSQKAVTVEADPLRYPVFKALGNFIYAVVDSERVYIMGRRLKKSI